MQNLSGKICTNTTSVTSCHLQSYNSKSHNQIWEEQNHAGTIKIHGIYIYITKCACVCTPRLKMNNTELNGHLYWRGSQKP